MAEVDITGRSEKPVLPEVVDDKGHTVVGPEMEAVTHLMIQMAQLAQQVRIRKSVERDHVKGEAIEKRLSVTPDAQVVSLVGEYPYTPLATVSFQNDGDHSAFVSINNAYHWKEVRPNEVYEVDLTKADQRLQLVHYHSNPGETTSIRMTGKY